ncbi:MAG: glutamate--tRNA ligase family protein, partial [Deferrisomatales bacterium]
ICTLEFEDHRPLYDWFVRELGIFAPQQIEFARLNLTYTVMSKRRLLQLVQEGRVRGWDDPRMPTLSGMRRRGYPPEAIREFCARIGVAKRDSTVELALLEHCVRDDLNRRAPRAMAVLRPLKLVIENYPEGQTEELEAVNNPEDPAAGTRRVPFSRVLYIEQEDFREQAPPKYFRLTPGREVRLRYAYFVKCTGVVKDDRGEVVEVRCTYDPATLGGDAPDGRKVKATIHWVSAAHAVPAEVRLYDRLFRSENPGAGGDFLADLNPGSLEVVAQARLEPGLGEAKPGDRVQFERLGYFCCDPDSVPGAPVFNRTVTLKDPWAKIEARGSAAGAAPARRENAPAARAAGASSRPGAARSRRAYRGQAAGVAPAKWAGSLKSPAATATFTSRVASAMPSSFIRPKGPLGQASAVVTPSSRSFMLTTCFSIRWAEMAKMAPSSRSRTTERAASSSEIGPSSRFQGLPVSNWALRAAGTGG